MLYLNFTRILEKRGIEKPHTYLTDKGISKNFATRIVHNRIEKLNVKDLERICTLLQCTPNDLLSWHPDKNVQNIESHPLFPLIRNDKTKELNKLLQSLPLEKIQKIEELISQEIKND